MLVRGQRKDTSDKETPKTIYPTNGSVLAEYAGAIREDVDEVAKATWKALEPQKYVMVNERAVILSKTADIIDANQGHLAAAESLGNGKPIRETMIMDIPMSAQHFRYFAGCIMADEGSANILGESTLGLILKKPIGAVGQIVPRNFPFLMAAWKLAPMFACRCCIVFKSSSATSLSVLEFAKLIQDVLPTGVFNATIGSGFKSSQHVLEHEGFRKLALTGSTEVDRNAALAVVQKLIPSTLELGGEPANTFFGGYNWEMAVGGLRMGTLFNRGWICCAGSRAFVQEDIYDRLVGEAVKCFDQVRVGLPWEADTRIGDRISRAQIEKILKYIEARESKGTSMLREGQRLKTEGSKDGCFLKPTLLENVTNHMRVAQEEIFRPVACILKSQVEGEVIQTVNDSEYSPGGAVWARNINGTLQVSRAIETGRVWVDTYNTIPEEVPFRGYKTPGVGRETHKVMLGYYTQMENIMINLGKAPIRFHPVR